MPATLISARAPILGTSVLRVEDHELLTGQAAFVDDLRLDDVLHIAFVRSPHAHARVRAIDGDDAATMPGVVAVLCAADLDLPDHRPSVVLDARCARPPLAKDKVRFVGEAVAVVVASSRSLAVDAADAVVVDYDVLPAVVDAVAALAPDAPLQFDGLDSNRVAGAHHGASGDVLADAEVVVRARFEIPRIAVVPLEGNAIAVDPGRGANQPVTVHLSTQRPHAAADQLCTMFGLAPGSIRVVVPQVGGAFGGKFDVAAEHVAAIGVALHLRRPVKWIESRTENLVAMPHGRGQVQYAELGCTRGGRFTGLRMRVVADAGAYAGPGGAFALGPTPMMASGVYRIPAIAYDAAVAVTNTSPMGAFRGAGRPEATACLERVIDIAADELGIDPVELRRRNFLPPEQFPVTTAVGTRYDSGDYEAALTRALEIARYDELRAEQARRRDAGDSVLLGIGVSTYVGITANSGGTERASVSVDDDGGATIAVGTSAHGQGHATSFAMIVADRLGIALHRIRLVQPDTAHMPRGGGTSASRSLQLGGSAVAGAARAVLERARGLAAVVLGVDIDSVVVTADGRVGRANDRGATLTWRQLASSARERGEPLSARFEFRQEHATFPFGAHVAVVEVDTETGAVRPVRHVAVDDCGRVLNPLLVRGQQHGGAAQGIALALWEHVLYDEVGNPLTTTLVHYGIPGPRDLPSFETANTETPTPLNELGAKGVGESATIGATPAVQNAVVDALAHLGVRHIDLPCTSERVWRAVEAGRAGALPAIWREPPPVFAAAGDVTELDDRLNA